MVHGYGWNRFGAVMAGSVIMLLGCVTLEKVIPRKNLPTRLPGTMRVDLLFNLITLVSAVVVPSFIYIPFGSVAAESLGTSGWWADLPLWASCLLAILGVDFFSYWWHRSMHTTGDTVLWRIHSVHHAPTHYDFWMGARVHPFDVLGFGFTGYCFVAILGAPVEAAEFAAYFAALVGAVHHISAETDCGWINRIIPMGDHHLVHHSRDSKHDGNYGNIMTILDQLFGTYRTPMPDEAPPQGAWSLVDDYPTDQLGFILMTPFKRWWKKVKRPVELSYE
jgi:sterol desaturase/sphingolipid hydroxylase (fatty acid hydroxylase superfamily)